MHHRDRHLGASRPLSPAAPSAAGSKSLPGLPLAAEGRVARRYPHARHIPPQAAELERSEADTYDTAIGKPVLPGAVFLACVLVLAVYAVIVAVGQEVVR